MGSYQDARFALRMLHRTPSVSIPAIVCLALGIGAATALYAVVYAMWLRPLPYPDADRLVSITTYFAGYKLDALASADYGSWQGTRSLGALGAYSVSNAAISAPENTIEVSRAQISGNLLEILHIDAALGRGIQPDDDSPNAPRVAMLSDGVWRHQFGSDRSVIGKSTRIDGQIYTILGVLPSTFRMPSGGHVDILTPLSLGESWLRHGSGGMKILYGVGRLQPGMSIAQARAELATRLAASRAQDPEIYRDACRCACCRCTNMRLAMSVPLPWFFARSGQHSPDCERQCREPAGRTGGRPRQRDFGPPGIGRQ